MTEHAHLGGGYHSCWEIIDEMHALGDIDLLRHSRIVVAPPPTNDEFHYHVDADGFEWVPHDEGGDRWYTVSAWQAFTVDGIVYDRGRHYGGVNTAHTMIELRDGYSTAMSGTCRQRWDLPPLTDSEYLHWWNARHRG